jgi:Short C-terminal domain
MKHAFAARTLVLFLLGAGALAASHSPQSQRSASVQEKIDALKQAYKEGLLTDDEYARRLRALGEKAPLTRQEKIEALNDAYKNGLLSQQEYDAKLKALNFQGVSAAAGEEPPQDFGPTKTVAIIDPMFQMVAYTMEIPASWNFEGVVLHGPGCQGSFSSVVYRAFTPDMRYGVQLLPSAEFYWADDPRTLPKFGKCKYLPPISAADYAQFVSMRMRPDAEIDSVSPAPQEADFQANLSKTEFTFFNQVGIMGELKRTHVRFQMDGQPEEEILQARMVVRKRMVLTNVSKTAMVGYRPMPQYTSNADIWAVHAPQGQLTPHLAAMLAIMQSRRANQEYIQTSNAYFQNQTNIAIANSWAVFNTTMQASQQMAEIRSQNAQQFIQNMNAQGQLRHEQVMANIDQRDRHTKDVCDWILNQQLYQNPNTGQTFKASNQYKYTYQDQSGHVLQSDTIVDPNELYHADWTSPVPIHH